jgi:cell division protein FtsB
MLVAQQRQYDYIIEEPIYKPKKQIKKKTRIKKYKKVKYITFTLIGFIIAITILVQYAELNIVNQEINLLEKELQELHMLNDSVEGELLASEDLKIIEKIAREELGMIEPTSEQMTIIEIQNSQDMEFASANIENTSSSNFLESLSKVLDFID